MFEARVCKPCDVDGLRVLWKECFGDTDEFLDFYFGERFDYKSSMCVEHEGQIIASMYGLKANIHVRDKIIKGSELSGIAVHPDFRRRGIMDLVVRAHLDMLYESGIILSPHTPEAHATYFKYGHYTATDSKIISGELLNSEALPSNSVIKDEAIIENKLLDCYVKYVNGYSGILCRSDFDFALKAKDYLSSEAELIVVENGDEVSGYAFYIIDEKNHLEAPEVVALDEKTEQALVNGLCNLVEEGSVLIKLPPNSTSSVIGLEESIIPHGVCGFINVQKALSIFYAGVDAVLKITDTVIPRNDGVFTLNGIPSSATPQLEISSGRLLQILEGYKSFQELHSEGELICSDSELLSRLDTAYPKQICYIIDEY